MNEQQQSHVASTFSQKSKLDPPVLSLALSFMLVFGAGTARNESTISAALPSAPPLFHLLAFELATSITAFYVPFGIVATSIALCGISAFVLCERLEKDISNTRRDPSSDTLDFFTLTSVGGP